MEPQVGMFSLANKVGLVVGIANEQVKWAA
jgi:hypothetical protein